MAKGLEKTRAAIQTVSSGAQQRETEMMRKLESRHAAAEEVALKHWSHIRNVEELCRTKADRDMVQKGLDTGVAALAACDDKHTKRVDTLTASTTRHQEATDAYLASLNERLTTEEATMLTKSTLVETQELRDKIALCALRTETRELIDVIRQEVAARVRMMKERLDRTDHELMRQLEESCAARRSPSTKHHPPPTTHHPPPTTRHPTPITHHHQPLATGTPPTRATSSRRLRRSSRPRRSGRLSTECRSRHSSSTRNCRRCTCGRRRWGRA